MSKYIVLKLVTNYIIWIYCPGLAQSQILTLVVDEVLDGGPGLVVAVEGDVGRQAAVDAVLRAAHTLLPQVPHKELQADEGEDAQTEDGEDHHVGELLHGLDQSANDGLQACRDRAPTHTE